jgi:hypothetical protein
VRFQGDQSVHDSLVQPTRQMTSAPPLNLRAGEWIEVRSPDEIRATLDENACLEGMPFMPEMLQYCGKRFRVYKSAHKTCDTIETYVIRKMSRAVHLEGLRCDGSGHGGCQAGCLIYWKDAWLKRAEAPTDERDSSGSPALEALSRAAAVLRPVAGEKRDRYRCQATEVVRASTEVRRRDRWDPRFYIQDLRSRNVGLGEFLWYGAIAAFNAFSVWLGWRRYPHLCGLAGQKTPSLELGLQPGQPVKVRSKAEIMKTLNPGLRNKGLLFDYEMVPFCENGTYPVMRKVERIINEKTGYMFTLPNPCVILDGVTCSGKLSSSRMFCPRAVYPYWHEIWLQPAGKEGSTR